MTDQDKDNYGIEGNEPPLPAKVYKYGKTIGWLIIDNKVGHLLVSLLTTRWTSW